METLVLAAWCWCLVCLGEVESGPVLVESSSAWVTQGEQAGGPVGLPGSWRGWVVLQLGPEWTPTCFRPIHLCGFQVSSQVKLWLKTHPGYSGHFHYFPTYLKSTSCWSTEPEPANSTKMDLLSINSRNTQYMGHVWLKSPSPGTKCHSEVPVSGFSKILLDSHFAAHILTSGH